ncbi:MAG: hypothetical protein AMXMBFR61_17450 [Fimbriimonadales bacterium]
MRGFLILTALTVGVMSGGAPLGVGSKVPELTLPRATGPNLKLSTVWPKHPATILYFWSFERGANPDEFLALQNLHTSSFPDVGIVALCINGTDTAALDWQKQTGCTFEFAVDASAQGATARMFGVKRYPTVFLVDREGRITYRSETFDEGRLREALVAAGCTPNDGE